MPDPTAWGSTPGCLVSVSLCGKKYTFFQSKFHLFLIVEKNTFLKSTIEIILFFLRVFMTYNLFECHAGSLESSHTSARSRILLDSGFFFIARCACNVSLT